MSQIESVKNVTISAFLNGAGITSFYYEMSDPLQADICIVRQVSFNSPQFGDSKVYHIWSDLTDGIIASFSGQSGSVGNVGASTACPQTILKLRRTKVHNIKFQIMGAPQTTITQNGMLPEPVAMVNTYTTASLTIMLDFIRFKK